MSASGLRFLANALDFIYPPLCIICGELSGKERHLICSPCLDQLEMLDEAVVEGLKSVSDLDEVRSVFVYNDPVKTIIHHLKYRNATPLARLIAPYMAFAIRDLREWQTADFLVPIPLHPVKQRERGYNQSGILAQALSEKTGIPVREDILRRRRYTISQTQTAGVEERQKNVRSAFQLNLKVDIAGKKIILIDDVVTTGSTANTCAALLKSAEASSVFLLTLAHPAFHS